MSILFKTLGLNLLLLIIIFISTRLSAIDKLKKLIVQKSPLTNEFIFYNRPSERAYFDEIIYSENFDSGAPGWTTKDFWSESSWHINSKGAFAGNSYWCGIEQLDGYDDSWQHALISPQITLPSSDSLSLTFWHNYNVEDTAGSSIDIPDGYDAWDAITVQISTDGVTFVPLIPEGGYKASNASAFYYYYGHGLSGWFGSSNGWIQAVFNLNTYASQTIWIRLELSSDTGFSSAEDESMFGWRVDDIEIKDGTTTISFDDAGDTSPAQFIPGGISRPSLWHSSNSNSNSTPYSMACFDTLTGNYLPGMFNALVSPPINIVDIPSNTSSLTADFKIQGKLDPFHDPNYCYPDGYCWPDYFFIEVRGYRNGAWGYWDYVGVSEEFNSINSFVSYNSINMHPTFPDFDLLACDSVQYRIYLLSTADQEVITPAFFYVDDFILTASFPTSVNNDNGNQPDKYYLSNNYPNPFNPTTNFEFGIAQTGLVSLKVFDVLGKEIATLVNEEKPAGGYKIDFNGDLLSSGVYFYTLQAGEFRQTKKMILAK